MLPSPAHIQSLSGLALLLAAGLAGIALSACSYIEFERGPYAVRGVDVVYSAQEDLTFIVWRLPDEARADQVHFELFFDGEYYPLELGQAPFPAKPYTCDRKYLCFQYQLEGRYEVPDDARPIRSVHVRHGLIEGTLPRRHNVDRTFGVAPIGLDNNRRLDPRRFDWFAEQNIPLRRDYQWQLVDAAPTSDADMRAGLEEICAPPLESWQLMQSRLDVPYSWVEQPRCMAARPLRTDRAGVLVNVPFLPSAELFWERQDYLPREAQHPTVYAFLYDMQVRNAGRCAQIKRTIEKTLKDAFSEIAEERPQSIVHLGVYTPTAPQTGDPLDGCSQNAMQDYPITTMVEDVKNVAADFGDQGVRVIWIYVNNVELPPSERLINQLFELEMRLATERNIHMYSWTIGSNLIMSIAPWDWTTGWRPVEDETFIADLESFADYNMPFRTMLHDERTEIPIRPLEVAQNPSEFKICQSTVAFDRLRTTNTLHFGPWDRAFTWPESDRVLYQISLSPQERVPFQEYRRQINSVVVEVCERFCANPFRNRAGLDFDNWRTSLGRCQWG